MLQKRESVFLSLQYHSMSFYSGVCLLFVPFKLYFWSKSISRVHLGLEITIEIALISILRILGFKILKCKHTIKRSMSYSVHCFGAVSKKVGFTLFHTSKFSAEFAVFTVD